MATETTVTSAKAWAADITALAPDELVPDALILDCATYYGTIEGDAPAIRVAFVDDAAASIVPEGGAIAESVPGLSEILVYTSKIAQLVRLSREQLTAADASSRLASSVERALTRKADQVFLTQPAPTAPDTIPPAGLLHIPGTIAGDPISTDLDPLIDLMATLEANGSQPSTILCAPTTWAALRKLKTATGSNANLLGAGTTDSTRALLDVPVRISAALPAGSGIIIDKTAIAAALGNINIAWSDDVYFTSDSIGLRATWRFGANCVHPDRIGTFTIAPEDAPEEP